MEDNNMDCIFCKIISEDIQSYTIYKDKIVKFFNVNPDGDGKCLIVPKNTL